MICAKCGNNIPEDSEFCQYCGGMVDAKEAMFLCACDDEPECSKNVNYVVENKKRNKRFNLAIIVLTIICLAFAVVAVYEMTQVKKSNEISLSIYEEKKEIEESRQKLIIENDQNKKDIDKLKERNKEQQEEIESLTSALHYSQEKVSAYNDIVAFAEKGGVGAQSNTFKVSENIIVMDVYDSAKYITLTCDFSGYTTFDMDTDGFSAYVDWTENNWNGSSTKLKIMPVDVGVTTVTIDNNKNSKLVKFIIIVKNW